MLAGLTNIELAVNWRYQLNCLSLGGLLDKALKKKKNISRKILNQKNS